MLRRLRYIGRVISLFFRLFIVRSAKAVFTPGRKGESVLPSAPPVVTKALYGEILLSASACVLVGAICITLAHLWNGKGQPYISLVLMVGFSLGHRTWKRRRAGGISDLCCKARENNYLMCLHCGYSLRGLPSHHQCPECGKGYEIEEVKARWATYAAGERSPAAPPAPSPPIVNRFERWQRLCKTVALGPVLLLVAFYLLYGKRLTPADSFTRACAHAIFPLLLASMLMAAWMGRKITQMCRRAHAEEYALCPICGCSLRNHSEKHRCPECGSAYDIAEVKRRWSTYIADRTVRRILW